MGTTSPYRRRSRTPCSSRALRGRRPMTQQHDRGCDQRHLPEAGGEAPEARGCEQQSHDARQPGEQQDRGAAADARDEVVRKGDQHDRKVDPAARSMQVGPRGASIRRRRGDSRRPRSPALSPPPATGDAAPGGHRDARTLRSSRPRARDLRAAAPPTISREPRHGRRR